MIGNLVRTTCSAVGNRVIQAAVKESPKGFFKNVGQITNNSIALGKPALLPKPAGLCEKGQSLTQVKSAIISVHDRVSKFGQLSVSQPHQQGVGASVGKLDLVKFAKIIECEKAKPGDSARFTKNGTNTKPADVTKSAQAVGPKVMAERQSQPTQPQPLQAQSPKVLQKDGQGVPPPPPWLDILPTVIHAPQSLNNAATENSVPTTKVSSKPSPASGEKLFSADLMSDLNAALKNLRQNKRTPQQ